MIQIKKNINLNLALLTNLCFGFFPISFIFGNLITNINLVLFCFLGIYQLRSKILTTKFNLPLKAIFLFFLVVFLSTSLSFIRALYLGEYEVYDSVKLTKSIFFFRFFLLLLIAYYLSKFNILNFKYFLISAACAPVFISLDIIYQYIFKFNIIGLKSLDVYNTSFFGDEYIAGGYIKNFFLFSIIFLFFTFKNRLRFALSIIMICILGLGVLFSGNRMPLILFFLGLFLLFLFSKKLKPMLLVSFFSLFIILGIIGSFDDKIKNKYISYRDNVVFILSSYVNLSEKIFPIDRKVVHKTAEKLEEEEFIASGEIDINLENYPTYSKYPIGDEFRGFLYPPKWEKGKPLADDFEFFWVIQYEVDDHLKIFYTALDIWGNNKIFGNGIKSFRYECKKFLIHVENRLCSTHPHNYYLEILTDVGIIGIIATLIIGILFVLFIIRNLKSIRENNIESSILLVSTITMILEVFPIKSTGSIFTTSNATYLVLIASILLSYNNLSIDKKFR